MYDIKKQISMSQFQIYAGLNWKPLHGCVSTDFLLWFCAVRCLRWPSTSLDEASSHLFTTCLWIWLLTILWRRNLHIDKLWNIFIFVFYLNLFLLQILLENFSSKGRLYFIKLYKKKIHGQCSAVLFSNNKTGYLPRMQYCRDF